MPTGCPSKLRRSERPDRIFEAALDTAKQAGIVGSRQALGYDVSLVAKVA